jgi:hypothetical protein
MKVPLSSVYIEVNAVTPSGAYGLTEEDVRRMVANDGYAWEEVGLFRGRYLDRAYLDDGAAEIDGNVVDLGGEAHLRVRYLSKYNFLLAAQDSALNNNTFDLQLHSLMNGVLVRPEAFQSLVDAVERLPKQASYFGGGGSYAE